MPVSKRPGDVLIGGAFNGPGLLLMRAARVGGGTLLSGVVRLVQEAQANKAHMQVGACACMRGPGQPHRVACARVRQASVLLS